MGIAPEENGCRNRKEEKASQQEKEDCQTELEFP
jgi:hypothetical protein